MATWPDLFLVHFFPLYINIFHPIKKLNIRQFKLESNSVSSFFAGSACCKLISTTVFSLNTEVFTF